MAIERLLLDQLHAELKKGAKGNQTQVELVQSLLGTIRRAEVQGYVQPSVDKLVPERDSVFVDGNFTHYRGENRVVIDGREVRLSKTEEKVLTVLDTQAGVVVKREDAFRRVWGEHPEYGSYDIRRLDVAIVRLRRKFREQDGDPSGRIQTVRGAGYMFAPQVPTESPALPQP